MIILFTYAFVTIGTSCILKFRECFRIALFRSWRGSHFFVRARSSSYFPIHSLLWAGKADNEVCWIMFGRTSNEPRRRAYSFLVCVRCVAFVDGACGVLWLLGALLFTHELFLFYLPVLSHFLKNWRYPMSCHRSTCRRRVYDPLELKVLWLSGGSCHASHGTGDDTASQELSHIRGKGASLSSSHL